jgi:hypothetical protein
MGSSGWAVLVTKELFSLRVSTLVRRSEMVMGVGLQLGEGTVLPEDGLNKRSEMAWLI